jgi:hypothetical protein
MRIFLIVLMMLLTGCQSTGGGLGFPTKRVSIGMSEAEFLSGHYCFMPYLNPQAGKRQSYEYISADYISRSYYCQRVGRLSFTNGSLKSIYR